MRLNVKFKEIDKIFSTNFGEVHNISDGGYERGYETGYIEGGADGYTKGHTDGQTDGLESLFLKTIKSFSSNNVTSIENNTFFNCAELEELNLPNLKSVPISMCQYCSKLKRIVLPNLTGSIGTSAFHTCRSLEYADIGAATNLGAAGFYMCASLATLIIRGPVVIPIANSNALYGTRIANKTGYIYVRDDLVEQYKVATYWSTLASQIKPLSELEG